MFLNNISGLRLDLFTYMLLVPK